MVLMKNFANMNEQTNALLRDLAAKLGTTVEHIWGVLLKQAHVELIKDTALIILTILAWSVLLIIHFRIKKKDGYTDKTSSFGFSNDSVVAPMVIGTVICLVLTIIALISINEIFDIVYNPEYWSLRQVLRYVR